MPNNSLLIPQEKSYHVFENVFLSRSLVDYEENVTLQVSTATDNPDNAFLLLEKKEPFASFRCMLKLPLDLTFRLSCWQAENLQSKETCPERKVSLSLQPTTIHTHKHIYIANEGTNIATFLWNVAYYFPPRCQVIQHIILSCSSFFSGGMFFFSVAIPGTNLDIHTYIIHKHMSDSSPLEHIRCLQNPKTPLVFQNKKNIIDFDVAYQENAVINGQMFKKFLSWCYVPIITGGLS